MGGMGGRGRGGMSMGGMGGTTGATRFVGRSDNAGRLVGGLQGSTSAIGGMNGRGGIGGNQFGNNGRGGNNCRGGNNGQNGFNNQFNQMGGNNGNSRTQTPTIQPQQKVAFAFSPPTAAKLNTTLDTRFQKMPSTANVKNVNISHVDGVVTIRGQVDSDDAKKLAERLVRLEPGVKSVQNELTVKGADTAATP